MPLGLTPSTVLQGNSQIDMTVSWQCTWRNRSWNLKHVCYTLVMCCPVLQLLPQRVLDAILFTRSAFVLTHALYLTCRLLLQLIRKIRYYLPKGVILSACSLTVTWLQAGPCSSEIDCLWALFPGTTLHCIQCYDTHFIFYSMFAVPSSAGAGCYSIRLHWSWRYSDLWLPACSWTSWGACLWSLVTQRTSYSTPCFQFPPQRVLDVILSARTDPDGTLTPGQFLDLMRSLVVTMDPWDRLALLHLGLHDAVNTAQRGLVHML